MIFMVCYWHIHYIWYYNLKRSWICSFQGLNNHFNTIKNQVSDLHRDVIRIPPQREGDVRSVPQPIVEYRRVEDIVIQCTSLTNELEKTDQLMKDRKDLFHKMWEEEQQRIMTEQSIFKEQVTCVYSYSAVWYVYKYNWLLGLVYYYIDFKLLLQLSELNSLRNDLRQLMEIAQQLEPYVRTSELDHPRSTKASAADLLSSSKGHSTNQHMGNAVANQFPYATKQESRKQQCDAMEFSSGSQYSSSAPVASAGGLTQSQLSEEYKRRSVFNYWEI